MTGESVTHLHRRWEDLRIWRLCLGLCPGPFIVAALIFVISLTDAETTASDFIWILGLLFLGVGWSQVTGWIYLLAVARPRGRIKRGGCLLLGMISICLIPLIVLFFATRPGSEAGPGSFLEHLDQRPARTVTLLVTIEIVCALFGLLSGWLFWRFGVKPSTMNAAQSVSAEALDSSEASETNARVFIALLLAAVPAAIPSLGTSLAAMQVESTVMLLVACPGTWLIGGGFYTRLRKTLRLRECLLLGMFLAFLQAPAGLLLAGLVGQFTNPETQSIIAPLQTVGFTNIMVTGVIELPYGLIGGWLFWRMASLPTASGMSPDDPALERRWHDLRKGRMIAALVIAPSVSLILLGALNNLALGPSLPSVSIQDAGKALLTFDLWCVAISFAYLFVCRRRGLVRCRDCLIVGIVSFCLFSTLEMVSTKLGLGGDSGLSGPKAGIGEIFFYIVAAALQFLPFGVLSGWMLWRFGVRPAKTQELAEAPVFD